MNFDAFFSDVHSLLTVISLVTFIGIVVWAWSARRARSFREAEMLPFADDAQHEGTVDNKVEKRHG